MAEGATSFVSAIPGYGDAIQGAVDSVFQVYRQWKDLQVHPKADEWVARVQNPFGATLSLIVDRKDAAVKDGTATADDVYFAQQAVTNIWNGYRATATDVAALGPDYSKVINGSYNTLQPLITSILGKMDNEINALGGISLAARVGVNVSHFRLLIWVVILFLVALLVYRRG